jgi:putative ABC transport system permease protein
VNPDVAPAEIITLRQLVRNRFYLVRAGAALMGAFAVLALVLAIVGVYGVTAYVVSQRTREVGLRLALGASRGAILRLVLVEGLTGVGVGLATGVALGLGAARLVSSLLFGIGAHDAVTFTAVPLLLLATACAACYVPARRASRLSPMSVLRRS